MTTVSIHQPSYLPWLGFLKIISSHVFVFLDDIKYVKNDFMNRNKIKATDDFLWLTVPVKANSKSILNDVMIDNTSKWQPKHKKSIYVNYTKTSFFDKYW